MAWYGMVWYLFINLDRSFLPSLSTLRVVYKSLSLSLSLSLSTCIYLTYLDYPIHVHYITADGLTPYDRFLHSLNHNVCI